MWLPATILIVIVIGAGAFFFKDSIIEEVNAGTTKGLALCEARNRSHGMTSQLVHERCREKHVRPVSASLKGSAGYVSLSDILGALISFQGSVTNESSDIVVTEYVIEVRHGRRGDMSFTQLFKSKWVEPNATDRFATASKRLASPPTSDDVGGAADAWGDPGAYQWSISGVKGVRVSF
jgi:hypothetical protein